MPKIDQTIKDVQAWMTTDEAQELLSVALAKAEVATTRLQEARRVHWQDLLEPFTI